MEDLKTTEAWQHPMAWTKLNKEHELSKLVDCKESKSGQEARNYKCPLKLLFGIQTIVAPTAMCMNSCAGDFAVSQTPCTLCLRKVEQLFTTSLSNFLLLFLIM